MILKISSAARGWPYDPLAAGWHFYQEWLHFVACNRSRELFPELRKKYAAVDMIGGKVADDQTAVTLNNYVAGAYGAPGTVRADRTAIELLEPERLQDQFCFRTAEAVCSLIFVRSERYDDMP